MKKLALAAALMAIAGSASASLISVSSGSTINVNTTDEYKFLVFGPDGGGPAVGTYTLNYGSDLLSTFSLIDTQDEEGDVRYTLSNGAAQLWTHTLTDLGSDAVTKFSEFVLAGSYTFTIENLTGSTASSNSRLSSVPLPGAAWLFGSGLLGFMMLSNRRKV